MHRKRKRYRVAREVFRYLRAPWRTASASAISMELEDLSFRYLEPVSYKQIPNCWMSAGWMRQDNNRRRHEAKLPSNELERGGGCHADIDGGPKHIYSIWRKMRRRGSTSARSTPSAPWRVLVPQVP